MASSPLEAHVWYWPQPDPGGDGLEALLHALGRAGLRTARFQPDRPPVGPGLCLFDAPDEAAVQAVGRCSRGGFNRVLAVARPGVTLRPSDAWRLVAAGASDVLVWDELPRPAEMVAARFERWRQVDRLIASPVVCNNLVGQSRAWTAVLRQVVEVAHFTEASVLILGESGTGKELVARLHHTLDRRPGKQRLVVLDCTTVVPELSGSEFFGHEKGAFTGAAAARDGAFALAHDGTLFLDEVGELPLPLQAELLRAVQEGTYKRVGSNTWRDTRFRLVCATNRDLMAEAAAGTFRGDLYYRIACWIIKLPPLRERREDILPLARHFLAQMHPKGEPPALDAAVRDYLLTRDYPGNVRELRQLVRRVAWRHVGGGPITVGDLRGEAEPAFFVTGVPKPAEGFEGAVRGALARGIGLKEIGKEAADAAVRVAVEDAEGNLQRAAERLGVTARALQLRRAKQPAPSNGTAT